MARSYLVLEDGSIYEGEAFGYDARVTGEVVFSTGMCGYQESLTDPSFRGQILVMTYPTVGNYGISNEFYQSESVHVRALAVREYCREPSKMYGGKTLDEFMKLHKVPGISGIDTRDLVIRIRTAGTLRGMVTAGIDDIEDIIKKLKKMPYPSESNLVAEVSCKEIKTHRSGKDIHVGMIDCGGKKGILKEMTSRYDVTVFPYDTPADVILASKVKGVLLSNGPGDPSHPAIAKTAMKTIRDLSTELPLFGICFGHQVISMAMGGKTYKMKFGHHGSNQPVKFNGRVYITSQNHGFAVEEESLSGTGLVANQINVNDGTVEGTMHKDLPIFTSQYHPEASPGPWDTSFLFDDFGRMIKEGRP